MVEHYLLEAALENAEALLDTVTDNEVLKNIPIVGTCIKVVKSVGDVRDRLLAGKLVQFCQRLNEVSPEGREKMRKKMASNPDEAERIGSTLMIVLDKITALEKADIVAYVFIAYTLDVIDQADLRRFLDAIDQAFVDDLVDLLDTAESKHSTPSVYMKHLERTGLTFADSTMIAKSREDWHYGISRLGKQFIAAYKAGSKYCTDHSSGPHNTLAPEKGGSHEWRSVKGIASRDFPQ